MVKDDAGRRGDAIALYGGAEYRTDEKYNGWIITLADGSITSVKVHDDMQYGCLEHPSAVLTKRKSVVQHLVKKHLEPRGFHEKNVKRGPLIPQLVHELIRERGSHPGLPKAQAKQRRKADEVPKIYRCPYCDKRYGSRKATALHARNHHGELRHEPILIGDPREW